MAINISQNLTDSMLNSILAFIDEGSGFAKIELRGGSKPEKTSNAAAGRKFATIELLKPSFIKIDNSLILNTPNANPIAEQTGTVGWFRLYSGANRVVLDGDVTLIGDGGDIEIDNTSAVNGAQVQIGTVKISF